MARPERHDADYFPFYCKDGRTLFILESKYQCKGTGFFTNVMRFLTMQPDHHICIKDEGERIYFFSRTRCDEVSGMDMLGLMAKTGKIDADMWVSYQVIVSQDLLNSLGDAYKNRKNKIITLDDLRVSYPKQAVSYQDNPQAPVITSPDNPQRKGKERKGNKTLCVYSDAFLSFWKTYPKKTAKKAAYTEWLKALRQESLPPLEVILSALDKQKRAKQKALDAGQFAPEWPDPERWIKKARWEDEIEIPHVGIPQAQVEVKTITCPNCGREASDIVEGHCFLCFKND